MKRPPDARLELLEAVLDLSADPTKEIPAGCEKGMPGRS